MTELQATLKIALANTYVMYAKAQSYHWNVDGMFFPMLHDFFGDVYEELHGPIDDLAERIRTLDGYAPISIMDIIRSATVEEDQVKPDSATTMLSNLMMSNNLVIESLNRAFAVAEQQRNQGIMDLLAGRLDAHAKHQWMFKSTLQTFKG